MPSFQKHRDESESHEVALFHPTTILPRGFLETHNDLEWFLWKCNSQLRSNLTVYRVESNLWPPIPSTMPVVTCQHQPGWRKTGGNQTGISRFVVTTRSWGSHDICDQMRTKFSLPCVVHHISLNCTHLFGMRQTSCPIGLLMNRKQFKRTGILSRIPKRFPGYTQEPGASS